MRRVRRQLGNTLPGIRPIYGYRDSTDPAEGFRLVRWLFTRAWLTPEQPSLLFDLATARLIERQVLLPGVSILARLVARIRERANARLYRKLAQMPSAEQRAAGRSRWCATIGTRPTAAGANPAHRGRITGGAAASQ